MIFILADMEKLQKLLSIRVKVIEKQQLAMFTSPTKPNSKLLSPSSYDNILMKALDGYNLN